MSSSKATQFVLPQTYLNFGTYVLGDVCPTTGTIFVKPVPKLIHTKGLVLYKGKKTHIAGVKGTDHDDCVPYADFTFDFAKSSATAGSLWKNPLVFGKIARASRAEFCFLPTGELVGSADSRLTRGGRNPKDQVAYAKLCTMTQEQRIAVIKSGELDSKGKTEGKKIATTKKKSRFETSADSRLMSKFIKRANAIEYLKTGHTEDINISYNEDSKNGYPFHRADYRKELERMMRNPAIAGHKFVIQRPQMVEMGSIQSPFAESLWEQRSMPHLETEYLGLEEFWTAMNEEFMKGGEYGEECRLNFGVEEEAVFVMSDDEDAEEELAVKVEEQVKRKAEVIALAKGGDLISALVVEANKDEWDAAKTEPVLDPVAVAELATNPLVVKEMLPADVKKAVEEVTQVIAPTKRKGRGKGKKKKAIKPLPKADYDKSGLSDEVVDAIVDGLSDEEVAVMAEM